MSDQWIDMHTDCDSDRQRLTRKAHHGQKVVQTYKNTGREREAIQTDRQTDRHIDRQIDRQTDRQTERQADTQTHRHTDRWIEAEKK